MTPDEAAARAFRAVPGDGPAAHACRLAVAMVLHLDDGAERDRWRSQLVQAEAAFVGRALVLLAQD